MIRGVVSPVGTELREVDVGAVHGLHHGSITLYLTPACKVNDHIVGSRAAQSDGGAVAGDSCRRERYIHVQAVGSISTADGRRIDTEHTVRVIECQGYIARQCLCNEIKGLGSAIVEHHGSQVDLGC